MAHLEFSKEITALLVIDADNEFISAGGKIWDRIMKVAEANVCWLTRRFQPTGAGLD
jgi:hypothetical protein